MPSIRPHQTNPDAFIVDIFTDRRRPVVCYSIEEALETIRLDPSFHRFKKLPPFTVKHLADRYLRRCERDGLSMVSQRTYMAHATSILGHKLAYELQSRDIMTWAAGLLRNKVGPEGQIKGKAYGTVAGAVSKLGELYTEAIQNGLLRHDPTVMARAQYAKPVVGTASRYPSPAEEAIVLERTKDAKDRLLMRLMLDAGLSKVEISPLRHCDFEGDSVRVSQLLNQQGKIVEAPEYQNRLVPLTDGIMEDLFASRLETEAQPGSLVFKGRQGKHFSSKGTELRVHRIMTCAGLGREIRKFSSGRWSIFRKGNFDLMDLSASAAIKWLRAGVNPVLVQRRLGYSGYKHFHHRYFAHINARPPGPDICAVDDLIWGTEQEPGLLGDMEEE